MKPIQIDGGRITFNSSARPGHPLVIDFSKGLISATRVGDDVVVSFRLGGLVRSERRRPDADYEWIVVTDAALNACVSDDSRSLVVEGIVLALPGKLQQGTVRSDGAIVLIYPNEVSGTRNLYRYNLDGTLKWQVGERTFQPSIPYNGFSSSDSRVLKAEGTTRNLSEHPQDMGALIDSETGEVLAQEDPRF